MTDVEKLTKKTPSLLFSVRALLSLLLFFGYALQYAQKINMSVSIVCMINNTALKLASKVQHVESDSLALMTTTTIVSGLIESTNETVQVEPISDGCLFQSTSSNASDGSFAWPKDIQGFILSGYFYGYAVSNLPGGILATKFGGFRVYLIAVLVGSLATLTAPFAARLNYIALIMCRIFTGISHGVMWPAGASLWAHWAPPAERSRLIAFANAGSQIGNVIALPLGGFLCVYGFDGGWPSIFYIFGAFGLLWCVAFYFCASDTPRKHKFIKENERDYILVETNMNNLDKDGTKSKSSTIDMKIIRAIFTSKACYALIAAHFASNWGAYLFLTNIPTYMKEVLKFDIKSNGLLSAIPYVGFWLVIIICGLSSDKLIQTKKISRQNVRRIYNTIGYLLPAIAVIALSFVSCRNPYVGVTLLTIGLSFVGGGYGGGWLVNFNDVAGPYSGLLFGITNTFGSIPGFVAPYLVGVLTKNQKQEEWALVFYITAAIFIGGLIVLLIFGQAEQESWSMKQKEMIINEEENVPLKENQQSQK